MFGRESVIIMGKYLVPLIVLLVMGLAQANEWQDFISRINKDWKGFVLEELPKFGEAGEAAQEQRCLERFAKKGVSGTILTHRIISILELNEKINVSKTVNFAYLLKYYMDRLTLIAHKESDSVTFLFAFPITEGKFNHLWCFARKDR